MMTSLQSFLSSERGHTKAIFQKNGYIFKNKRLCVPKRDLKNTLIREAYEWGLMTHFETYKTHITWKFIFSNIWGNMLTKFVKKRITCKKAKSKVQPWLYTPFPILNLPWWIFQWTLYLRFWGRKRDMIQSSCIWQEFLERPLLFHGTRLMMHVILQIYFSRK